MPNKFGALSFGMACLRNWWQADRIRLSPSQGRLMNIQSSTLLEIAGELWRVRSRHQDTVNGEMIIRYVCVKGDEMGELRVFMSNCDDWRSQVLWVCGSDSCALEESSVTVYPLFLKLPENCEISVLL